MDAAGLFAQAFTRVRYEDLPPDVVAITKHQILDLLGVAVAGIGQPGPRQLLELVSEWGDLVQVEISQKRYRALRLEKDAEVFITPKEHEFFVDRYSI